MSKRRNKARAAKAKQSQLTKLKTQSIEKASNELDTVSRIRLGEQGSMSMSAIRADSERMKAVELQWPTFIDTVECMKQDATVTAALDSKYNLVEKAFKDFKVLFNKDKPESAEAAKFVEYCLKNMDGQTLRQFAQSAATFNEYGFSVFEKVYTEVKAGEYTGRLKIKKLAFRPQASLSRRKPFRYSQDGNELLGVMQSKSAFAGFNPMGVEIVTPTINGIDTEIPRKKAMILTLGGTESNPMGVSPLVGCYRAFREKVLIENLEVIGATKDFGGIIHLTIPSTTLKKAAMDPSSYEAEMVEGLMTDAANAHSGDQSFFMTPSDTNSGGQPQYGVKLLGIEGSGKQYNTQELINARKKSILDRFGAGFLNVGNEQQGSYGLSESKQTVHTQFVQRDIEIILEGVNEDLIPQLLALNGIRLSQEDMPKVKSGLIADVDIEEFSKFVQRVGAVGYLPKTPQVVNKILEVGGFDDFRVEDGMSQEELLKLLGEDTSRSGDGMKRGTTGNGTGKNSSARDNSTSNMEN